MSNCYTNMGRYTENWVKMLHYSNLKNIIITSNAYLLSVSKIYRKRKNGDKMYLSEVKRAILKDLHILITQGSLRNTMPSFDEDSKILFSSLRTYPLTKNSWCVI